MDSELFGYAISTYLWVIGLSSISGTVKYLNEFVQRDSSRTKEFFYFIRDIFSGILSGLMAFWICEAFAIQQPLNAVVVTLAGIMGNRAWAEFEAILKTIILRIPASQYTSITEIEKTKLKDKA